MSAAPPAKKFRLTKSPAELEVSTAAESAAAIMRDADYIQRRTRDIVAQGTSASREQVRALMTATEAMTIRVKDVTARLESVENLLLPQVHRMARELVALQRQRAGPHDTPYTATTIFTERSIAELESQGKAAKAAAAAAATSSAVGRL